MRIRSLLPVAALAAVTAFGQIEAATALEIDVSVTIPASVDVAWCDADGTNEITTDLTWVLPAAINTTYLSTTAGTGITVPTKRNLKNKSTNCEIDVGARVADSSKWTHAIGAPAANVFRMTARVNAVDTILTGTDQQVVNNLAIGIVNTGSIDLQLETPSTITRGAGLAQLITVTFTASADNGD